MKDRKGLYWAVVYLYMGLIFYLSSLSPSSASSFIIFGGDKVSHFIEFLILGFLLLRALANSYSEKSFMTLKLIAATITIAYAASDEFHQKFVWGRNADFLDWFIDSFGGAIGSFVILNKKSRWLR